MKRRDVSFTFLHRVEEIESNIEDNRFQSALALALTLPDICGGIAFPEMVKRYKDGRVMLDRQKNPTRDVGAQYMKWFNTYAGPFFKENITDKAPYICGERCWQLRCEYLHQNKGFVNDEEIPVRFHLGVNCGTSICQAEKFVTVNGDQTDIRIDIEQFCWRMCQAAKSYYEEFHQEKDFSLYNTPVLDFIQSRQISPVDRLIAIVCQNSFYAKGIQKTLETVSNRIQVFESEEDAKRKLKKAKPAVWIVVDSFTTAAADVWWKQKNVPVILLTNDDDKNTQTSVVVLKMPYTPDQLRGAVRRTLRENGERVREK